MTPAVLLLLSIPCAYWTQGIETRDVLQAAGIKRLCVAAAQADAWRAAGFTVTPVSDADLAAREALPAPGLTTRTGVASPTRAPWIVANGWQFMRSPSAKYWTAPAGKAALAAAEAFAYGADTLMQIDPADVAAFGAMATFLDSIPAADLPPIADFTVIDDGSPVTGEVMNLLVRRNLLFEIARAPSTRHRITVKIGDPAYPAAEAADPSAFALKIRRDLTDEQRTLRVFGSEVVICRLTGNAGRLRLHLINYGGREIDGLRIRLKGAWRASEAYVFGAGKISLGDLVVADGATEFSVPRLSTYGVVDFSAAR